MSDLLGEGTACLVWSSPLLSQATRPLRYLRLMAVGKPWLLATIANGLGRETRLSYTPSTSFYLADRRGGQPWATRLPYPVQCLSKVEQLDHVTGWRFTSESAYHHGTFDGAEREFRGFGMVETWDTERFSDYEDAGQADEDLIVAVPPVRTRTWLHTGAWEAHQTLTTAYAAEYWSGDTNVLADPVAPAGREPARALKGRALRVEVYADDGDPEDEDSMDRAARPYSVTETTWEVRELQPAQDAPFGVYLVVPGPSRSAHYERIAADPRVAMTYPTQVDACGTVTRSFAVSYPRRSAASPTTQQQATHIVVTEVDVHHQDEDTDPGYHLAVPVRTRTWELTGLDGDDTDPFLGADLDDDFDTATEIDFEDAASTGTEKRLLGEQITEYWNDDLDAALLLDPVGSDDLESFALPRRRLARAFTPGLLTAVHAPTSGPPSSRRRATSTTSRTTTGGWRRGSRPTTTRTSMS